jgi:transcription antitermination factor NusG
MAMRWYSVSVLSNFEKKVAEAIREAVAQQHLEDEIEQVLVPTEDVTNGSAANPHSGTGSGGPGGLAAGRNSQPRPQPALSTRHVLQSSSESALYLRGPGRHHPL